MKQLIQVQQMVQDGALDEKLSVLCGGKSELDAYRARLLHTLEAFGKTFGTDREIAIFSAPGRTELGGNHTDHQHGHVLVVW